MRIVDRELPLDILSRWQSAHSISVLTGAGISAAAGLPTMSGPGSSTIWEFNLIEDLLCREKMSSRARVQLRWLDHMLAQARNAPITTAHRALATLSKKCQDITLITQNFDGLHARAGLAD